MMNILLKRRKNKFIKTKWKILKYPFALLEKDKPGRESVLLWAIRLNHSNYATLFYSKKNYFVFIKTNHKNSIP